MITLTNGINLGGWLSQYPELTQHHLDHFITRADIERIAEWGFQHVRLPVDYPVLENDSQPGVYLDSGFDRIESLLGWCEQCDLKVVFDLHHAPGFTFNNELQPETRHLNTLFTDAGAQERFVALWDAIIRRLKPFSSMVVFELLNEVVLPESDPWNALAQRTIDHIRTLSSEVTLMVGSNRNNAASELRHLNAFEDENLLYSFHFYEPLLFTHQHAPWVEMARNYQTSIRYGGEFPGLPRFLEQHPHLQEGVLHDPAARIDAALIEQFYQPVLDFLEERNGVSLYCGEFGVIESVPSTCKVRWSADLLNLLKLHQIGWAYWSYKAMDFGLVDARGELREPELLKLLTA